MSSKARAKENGTNFEMTKTVVSHQRLVSIFSSVVSLIPSFHFHDLEMENTVVSHQRLVSIFSSVALRRFDLGVDVLKNTLLGSLFDLSLVVSFHHKNNRRLFVTRYVHQTLNYSLALVFSSLLTLLFSCFVRPFAVRIVDHGYIHFPVWNLRCI